MKCHVAHLPAPCATASRGAHRRRRGDLPPRLLDGPRRHRVEARRVALRQRPDAGMVEDQEPELRAAMIYDDSNPELDRLAQKASSRAVACRPCNTDLSVYEYEPDITWRVQCPSVQYAMRLQLLQSYPSPLAQCCRPHSHPPKAAVVAVVVEAVAAAVVVEAVAAAVAPVVAAAVPAMGQAAAAEVVVVPPTVLAGAVAKVGAVAAVDGAITTVVDMVGAAAIAAAGATMPGAAGGISATGLILIDRLPRRVRSAGFCLPALIRNLGRRTMNVRPQRFLCAASYQKAQRTRRVS